MAVSDLTYIDEARKQRIQAMRIGLSIIAVVTTLTDLGLVSPTFGQSSNWFGPSFKWGIESIGPNEPSGPTFVWPSNEQKRVQTRAKAPNATVSTQRQRRHGTPSIDR